MKNTQREKIFVDWFGFLMACVFLISGLAASIILTRWIGDVWCARAERFTTCVLIAAWAWFLSPRIK